jgi:hypothetical protein
MSRNRVLPTALIVLAVALFPQLTARADRDVVIPGTACKPGKNDVGKINYSATSAVNESTSQATVVCPFNYPSAVAKRPSNAFVRVIDRNGGSDSDSTKNFQCTIFIIVHDGPGVVFKATAHSQKSLHPGDPNPIQDLDDTGSLDNGDGIHIDNINMVDVPGLVYSLTCQIPGTTSLGKSELVDFQIAPADVAMP